jgi:hypothetical protein
MSMRMRSLIASILMVLFLGFYIWAATAVAEMLPENKWVWLLYYPIVGTAWGVPLIPLLSWITKAR